MGECGLCLELLGTFRIIRAGLPPTSPLSSRSQALLAYLALRPGVPVARVQLAGLLWPDSTSEQARTNLRKSLHELRRALPGVEGEVLGTANELVWHAEGAAEVDVGTFRALVEAATLESLRQAAAFCRLPLLPGLSDSWVLEEREALRLEQQGALESLVELLESRGELREAFRHTEVLVALDPFADEPYRRLLDLSASLGEPGSLERYWRRYCDSRDELGALPSREVARVYEHSRASLRSPSEPAPAAGDRRWQEQVELIERSRLVGIEEHLEVFERFLADDKVRVLALTGVAGVGKSTLLQALGRELRRRRRAHALVGVARRLPTPQALWQDLGFDGHDELVEWASRSGAVLLVDDLDELAGLRSYLAEELVPALGENARLVVASRAPASLPWPAGSPWWTLVQEVEIQSWSEAQALRYLAARGVGGELAEQVVAQLGRTPLAVALGADVVARLPPAPAEWSSAPWQRTRAALVEAWLRDVPDGALRELLFSASMVREADQEMLTALVGEQVTRTELARLAGLSAVVRSEHGVALHEDLRQLLADDLGQRQLGRARQLRLAALGEYRRRMARAAPALRERLVADHLFLSQDAILRYLLFCPEEPRLLYSEQGGRADRDELERVLHSWGDERMDLPRPPQMIEATRAILAFKGTVLRLVRRRHDKALVGLAAAVPLCAESVGLLLRHPAFSPYVESRWVGRADLPASPRQSTSYHFAYAAYLDDVSRPTRARLIREMIGLLSRGGTYSLSTPDPEYQTLAETLGFRRVTEARHAVFGRHHPCEHYELDLTVVGFAGWVESLLRPPLEPSGDDPYGTGPAGAPQVVTRHPPAADRRSGA